MLRLIAICLALPFTLLLLAAADSPSRNSDLAPFGAPASIRAKAHLVGGETYQLQANVALRMKPEDDARRMGQLVSGSPVMLLEVSDNGYAHIRDQSGRVGYLPTRVLAAGF